MPPVTVNRRRPASNGAMLPIALLAAWLVPGAGHLLLGRCAKAAIFFMVVVSCFFAGIRIGGPRIVSSQDDKTAFLGQAMNGAMGLGYNRHALSVKTPLFVDAKWEMGKLYTIVAGLVNLLVVLDVYATSRRESPASVATGTVEEPDVTT